MPYLSSLSLAINRPGGLSLESQVAALFAGGEQGAWYDPSAANVTWRRNLLTRTEEFDNAAWTKTNSAIIANDASAPNSTATADKLVASLGAGTSVQHHTSVGTGTIAVGTNYTFSVYLKKAEYSWAIVYFGTIGVGRYIDLTTGNTGSTFVGTPVSTTVSDAGNGWWRVELVGFSGANTSADVRVYLASGNGNNLSVGDDASGIYLWGAQLERGTSATAYQRIVTPELTYLADVQSQPLLFTDAAGTTPVVGVESPVGLILDKRKGLVLGSELVTNGTFDTNTTGWTATQNAGTATIAVSSGRLALSGDATSRWPRATQSWTAVVGKTYVLSVDYDKGTASGDLYLAPIAGASIRVSAASGTIKYYWVATTTSGTFELGMWDTAGQNATCYFDNASIKLLDGNHAYQTSSAARPVLRARYNLLTYSEQFDNAAWTKGSATIGANVVAASDTTTTGDELREDASNAAHTVTQNAATVNGATYTFSVYAKASTRQYVLVLFGGITVGVVVNLSNGQITHTQGSPAVTPTVTDAGNGWYRISLSATVNTTNQGILIYSNIDGTWNGRQYQGVNLTSAIYLWGADLRVGTSAGTYQRIEAAPTATSTTAGAVTYAVGPDFPPYLSFDGSDTLLTAATDYGGTDKMTIWTGVMFNTISNQSLVEHGPTVDSTAGTFQIRQISGFNCLVQGNGGAGGGYITAAPSALRRYVVNARFDLSLATYPTRVVPRIDGVVDQTTATGGAYGTGNWSSQNLYIGSRPSSIYFNGYMYGMILRAASTTDAQTSVGEKYIASKMGVTL